MDIIDAERIKVLEEKAKLETAERLRGSGQSTHAGRSEIDEAIKVAQEACRQSDVEREKYVELQQQCETKRRKLINTESALRTKQNEFERKLIEAENEKVSSIKTGQRFEN